MIGILPPEYDSSYELSKKDWILVFGIAMSFIAVFFLIIHFISKKVEEDAIKSQVEAAKNTPSSKYDIGDVVYMKIGETKGMIIDTKCYAYTNVCSYDVRLYRQSSKTNTHLLRDDDNIDASQYSIIRVEEFEIDKDK